MPNATQDNRTDTASARQGIALMVRKGFADPFPGRMSSPGVPLTRSELERAVRLALAQEQEAIATYNAQAEATNDESARALLQGIAREEQVHVGELLALLERITGGQDAAKREDGQREADLQDGGATPFSDWAKGNIWSLHDPRVRLRQADLGKSWGEFARILSKSVVSGHYHAAPGGGTYYVHQYTRAQAPLIHADKPGEAQRHAPEAVEKRYGKEAERFHQYTPDGAPLLVRRFGKGSKSAYVTHDADGRHVGTLYAHRHDKGVEVRDSWTHGDAQNSGLHVPMLRKLVNDHGALHTGNRISADIHHAVQNIGADHRVQTVPHDRGGHGYVVTRPQSTLFKSMGVARATAGGLLLVLRKSQKRFDFGDTPTPPKPGHGHEAYTRVVRGKTQHIRENNPPRKQLQIAAQMGTMNENESRREGSDGNAEVVESRRGHEDGRVAGGSGVREDTVRRGSVDGGAGRGSGRSLVTARAEDTPDIDTSNVPEDLKRNLAPHQVEGVAAAVTAISRDGSFLLADGTGAGKTRQQLAVAEYYARQGRPVLIVAMSQVTNPDWKKGTLGSQSSFTKDAAAMGIGLNLLDASAGGRVKPGAISITTYTSAKRPDIEDVPANAVVIFDESHSLKNVLGAKRGSQSQWGTELAAKCHGAMFCSATPVDKVAHLVYLAKMGIMEGKYWKDQLRSLGLLEKKRTGMTKDKRKYEYVEYIEDPDLDTADIYGRIEALFGRLTRRGNVLKREIAMDDVAVDADFVKLPDDAHRILARIEDDYVGEDGAEPRGLRKACMRMHQRRQQEPYKVAAAVAAAKKELAEGRNVVIFCHRVNWSEYGRDIKVFNPLSGEFEVVDHETIAESDGTAKLLKQALLESGMSEADIVELHGGATKTAKQKSGAKDAFQTGKGKVMIATIEAGGVGINLDDTVGDAPRSIVCMTPPFDAVGNVQMAGRIWRMTTKTGARIKYLLADSDVDRWNAGIIAKKMWLLGASIGGELDKLRIGAGDANPDAMRAGDYKGAGEKHAPRTAPVAPQKDRGAVAGEQVSSAQAPAPSAASSLVNHVYYTTKGGKQKPVFEWSNATRLSREDRDALDDAGGWEDKRDGVYRIGDSERQQRLVERLTGGTVTRKLRKSLPVWAGGGLLLVLRKSQMHFDFTGDAGQERSHVAYTRRSPSGQVEHIPAKGTPKVKRPAGKGTPKTFGKPSREWSGESNGIPWVLRQHSDRSVFHSDDPQLHDYMTRKMGDGFGPKGEGGIRHWGLDRLTPTVLALQGYDRWQARQKAQADKRSTAAKKAAETRRANKADAEAAASAPAPEDWKSGRYSIHVVGDRLEFASPYDAELVKQLRSMKGTWDAAKKRWVLPLARYERLVALASPMADKEANARIQEQEAAEKKRIAEAGAAEKQRAANAEAAALARVRLPWSNAGYNVRMGNSGENVVLTGPFNEDLRAALRNIRGASWNGVYRQWIVPVAHFEAVLAAAEAAAKTVASERREETPAMYVWADKWGPNLSEGQVVLHGGKKMVVESIGRGRYNDDAMSFGGTEDRPYQHKVTLRDATSDEASAFDAAQKRADELRARAKQATQERADVSRLIRQGEAPSGNHSPEGETLCDTHNAYGGGDWFVVGKDYIWYVQNNGADGDDWSRNNVRTGGAGAIGWRVPYSKELADRIRGVDAIERENLRKSLPAVAAGGLLLLIRKSQLSLFGDLHEEKRPVKAHPMKTKTGKTVQVPTHQTTVRVAAEKPKQAAPAPKPCGIDHRALKPGHILIHKDGSKHAYLSTTDPKWSGHDRDEAVLTTIPVAEPVRGGRANESMHDPSEFTGVVHDHGESADAHGQIAQKLYDRHNVGAVNGHELSERSWKHAAWAKEHEAAAKQGPGLFGGVEDDTPAEPQKPQCAESKANASVGQGVATSKQPHEMTLAEFEKWKCANEADMLAKWRAAGERGIPPTGRMDVASASGLATKLGIDPKRLFDEDKPLRQHELHVAAALHDGKQVPAEVLADYPDLAEKFGRAQQPKPSRPRGINAEAWDAMTPEKRQQAASEMADYKRFRKAGDEDRADSAKYNLNVLQREAIRRKTDGRTTDLDDPARDAAVNASRLKRTKGAYGILRSIGTGAYTAEELAERTGQPLGAVKRHLGAWAKLGRVRDAGAGKYELPPWDPAKPYESGYKADDWVPTHARADDGEYKPDDWAPPGARSSGKNGEYGEGDWKVVVKKRKAAHA